MSSGFDWLLPTAAATAVAVTIPAVELTANELMMAMLATISGIVWLIRVSLRREKQMTRLEDHLDRLTSDFESLSSDMKDFRKQMRGADCINCSMRIKYKHLTQQMADKEDGE